MARKKSEGLEALIAAPVPSIQEITLLDWYAAFAMFNMPTTLSDTMTKERRAESAFEIARAMLKEREQHV